MGQFVDQHHLGGPGQDCFDVHLREGAAPVHQFLAGQHFQVAQHGLGERPAVGFHQADHHIRTALGPAFRLLEHLVRLAHTGRGSEVDPKLSS